MLDVYTPEAFLNVPDEMEVLLESQENLMNVEEVQIRAQSRGVLRGPQVQPRGIAELGYTAGWRDRDLVTMVAVCLAESQGMSGSYNDNVDADGKILSRDVGLMQINIPGDKVGTETETRLYDPVTNVAHARGMFESRGFQPWVAWKSGIALNPAWWRQRVADGVWAPTGRYVHRAVRGVANQTALVFKIESEASVFVDYRRVPVKPTGGA